MSHTPESSDMPEPLQQAESAVRVGGLMAALIAAAVAFQLNATMLVPAVGDLQHRLQTPAAQVGFALSVFFLSAGILSLFAPRLSDIVGRRRMLLASLGLLAVGAVLGAVAPNVGVLYLARVLQGAAGSVVPMCLLILRSTVEPARFGTLMSIVVAVNGGVAGVDVLAGGALASTVGFRAIFVVIVVVAVTAITLVWWSVPESRPSPEASMDWPGVLLFGLAVGTVTYYLSEGSQQGYTTLWMLVLLAVSAVSFIAFYRVEAGSTQPLIPTAVMSNRGFWSLLLTTLVTLAGIFGTMNFLVSSLAENATAGFGLNGTDTSVLFLMPYAVIGWIVGPFVGRAAPRVGWRLLLRGGLAGSVLVTLLMLGFGLHSPALMVVLSIAMGVTYAGVVNIILNGLGVLLSPPGHRGLLPGINSSAFNMGASIGTALLSAIIASGSPAASSSLSGYRSALAVAAAITVLAFLVSLLIPRPVGSEHTTATAESQPGELGQR